MCAFPHWADCRSDGDSSASAVVNNKQTLFCSNSLNSLQQVRVRDGRHFCVSLQYFVVQDPNQTKTRASPISVFDVEMQMYRKSIPSSCCCSSIGFMVIWVGLGARRPSSSRERRANELRVVFYGCENQPADAAAARKISLQCMSVTKHTVQQCHSSLSARKRNCARHSDLLEQGQCSLVHCSLYFLSLARTHTTGTGEQNEKLSAEVEMAD